LQILCNKYRICGDKADLRDGDRREDRVAHPWAIKRPAQV
jgi:hypothetical protein